MISFYPGPSRVHNEIPKYVKDAYKKGIMSINHRSEEFVEISKETISLLKDRLDIPENYTIFFTTSATESWEIIAQSLYRGKSYHFYNGAFGQKWFEYTQKLRNGAEAFPFDMNGELAPGTFELGDGIICLTQNETSNGTQVKNKVIKEFYQSFPNCLIAVDATSSMGGINLAFQYGDIWFASVQKCFGLPAGLGLLVCSPRAIETSKTINENRHYNSLSFMVQMMDKWQTPFTPNVIAIYLLMRVLESSPSIKDVEEKIIERYGDWRTFLRKRNSIHHLVENEDVHSYTVLPVKAEEKQITAIKKKAKEEGILLGEGYGNYKPYSLRIANFPAIKGKEIKTLKNFLKQY